MPGKKNIVNAEHATNYFKVNKSQQAMLSVTQQ
jgi:hypothetical protein